MQWGGCGVALDACHGTREGCVGTAVTRDIHVLHAAADWVFVLFGHVIIRALRVFVAAVQPWLFQRRGNDGDGGVPVVRVEWLCCCAQFLFVSGGFEIR